MTGDGLDRGMSDGALLLSLFMAYGLGILWGWVQWGGCP